MAWIEGMRMAHMNTSKQYGAVTQNVRRGLNPMRRLSLTCAERNPGNEQ